MSEPVAHTKMVGLMDAYESFSQKGRVTDGDALVASYQANFVPESSFIAATTGFKLFSLIDYNIQTTVGGSTQC